MSTAAWSFVDYSCGHSTPIRGGDRTIAGPCPACMALGRPTPYCVCGAQAPYDHNLACPHAERPTRTPVGCATCEAYRSRHTPANL
jgi:hypothetical protein